MSRSSISGTDCKVLKFNISVQVLKKTQFDEERIKNLLKQAHNCSNSSSFRRIKPISTSCSFYCYFYIILEPVGSVPPKLTSLHDKFQFLQVKIGQEYAMQCPGQAYPVPIVRCVNNE